jgi:solute carrier family 25 protein 44
MDKTKYYLYGPSLFFLVRASLHPFSLVKTRLQMQRSITSVDGSHHMVQYAGTFDAFRKIVKYEGFPALYKGFGVSTLGMIAGQLYITSYEIIRAYLVKVNDRFGLFGEKHIDVARNTIAGGVSSLLSQMIVVPVDVVSQKRMMYTGLAQVRNA